MLGAAAIATAGGCAAERAPAPSAVGGPFQLVNQDGRSVDQTILEGKWSAVFFGFTYCPDYCPTTLAALRGAEAELGRRAEDFQTVFISVDPERDTPASLKAYVENEAFPENTIALTGTAEQVAAAAKAYKAYFRKSGEGEDYLVDHTTVVYLMDPKGRFVAPLASGTPPKQMAAEIRDAMRQA
jgi:protein SCO1/2